MSSPAFTSFHVSTPPLRPKKRSKLPPSVLPNPFFRKELEPLVLPESQEVPEALSKRPKTARVLSDEKTTPAVTNALNTVSANAQSSQTVYIHTVQPLNSANES